MSKKKDKQQEIVGRLLTSALHYAGETGLPFVLIIADSILSNCPEQHARMIIQDAAELQQKIREVKIENQVNKMIGYGSGDDEATAS